MHERLKELNSAQRRAVEAGLGPVLVLAGPGSGKTRVLTYRVAYLVEAMGINPRNILAVTFTNKAAREMRERLQTLVGPAQASALTVGTFHTTCARFLRRDIVHLERANDFAIYDGEDQERLMRQVVRELGYDEKLYKPRSILSEVSRAKNELISPDHFLDNRPTDRSNRHKQKDEVAARCYLRYQQLLHEYNALDFDDLLLETVRLFHQHQPVLHWYQQRYTHLLVDEYQDTNRAQYLMVRALAEQHRNLFVVGDEEQSIYSWRGADIRNILEFEHDYPEAQVILLEQNYRSTQAILDVSQAIIRGGPKRPHPKNLWTENGAGQQVILLEGFDQTDEATCVVDEIVRMVDAAHYRWGDCAIMYRTNAQSRAIEEALALRGIPYQLVGGTRFYERKEVKDVLAYLRLAFNPFDRVSFERIINVPTRGIGKRALETLHQWSADIGLPLYQALHTLSDEQTQSPFNTRARNALLAFYRLIQGLLEDKARHTLPTMLENLLERLQFHAALVKEYGEEEGKERWSNVQELHTIANEYLFLPRESQLETFLEEVTLFTNTDRLDEDRNTVTCITLHQAKGLEYPVVFLVGLEEGLLPHGRSMSTPEALEEERRLFYVGATRAQQQLYLVYAFRRMSAGMSETSTPSRFLRNIPRTYLERPIRSGRSGPTAQQSMFSERSRYGTGSGGRPRPTPRPTAAPSPRPPSEREQRSQNYQTRFRPGQRVRHHLYGDGTVLSSEMQEWDEAVLVRFDGGDERNLLASFAQLELLP